MERKKYIKPEEVSPEEACNVLGFLNSAETAKEIAEAVEIPGERDVGIRVAERILARRDELGEFTDLQQVADVQQVGEERFTEIVMTLRGQGGAPVADFMEIKVEKYGYFFWSSLPRNKWRARIFLYTGSGGLPASVLSFWDDSSSLPAADVDLNGTVNLHYRFSAMPAIIDMLRNESPVYVYYIEGALKGISTRREPVGEGE